MPEAPHVREQASYAAVVAEFEGVFVAFASAWVDEAFHAGVDEESRAVIKGEECVAGGDGVVHALSA